MSHTLDKTKNNLKTTLFNNTKALLACFCSEAALPAEFTLRARSNEFTIDIKPPYKDDIMLAEPKLKKTSATIIEIEPWHALTTVTAGWLTILTDYLARNELPFVNNNHFL